MGFNFFKIAKGLGLKGQDTTPTNPVNGDLYYNSGVNKFKGYQNGLWLDMIGGSGGSGINYILNPDAEADTTGWATYKDAAAATPVDGTGGTATNISFNRTLTSPLRGVGSFRIDKAGSNAQGEGVSYAFSIDSADTSKRLSISFDIKDNGMTSGDIGVYVYDVTNATLLVPSVVSIPGTNSYPTKFQAFFNATTSTSYRLILHFATTSTAAWYFMFDNVQVGPQSAISVPASPTSQVSIHTPTGYGSSGTKIRTFTSANATTVGKDITYVSDTTNGDYFLINRAGIYTVNYADSSTAGGINIGISLNSSTLTTNITDTGVVGKVANTTSNSANQWAHCTACVRCAVGDKVRAHSNGNANYADNTAYFRIVQDAAFDISTTVNNSQVEYAFNTSTADSADTTSFGYGPAGTQANYSFSANRSKRVRFLTPIQSTDKITLEFSEDRISWRPLPFNTSADYNYAGWDGFSVGAYFSYVAGSSTDIDVIFGRYRSGTGPWNSVSIYWRLSKSSNPLSVRSGPILPIEMTREEATKLGYFQYNSATAYNGGVTPTVTGTGWTSVRDTFTPYQTNDGSWRLRFNISGAAGSSTRTSYSVSINGVTFKNVGSFYQTIAGNNGGGNGCRAAVNPGASSMSCAHASATTNDYAFSGDVELDSKPTWAW